MLKHNRATNILYFRIGVHIFVILEIIDMCLESWRPVPIRNGSVIWHFVNQPPPFVSTFFALPALAGLKFVTAARSQTWVWDPWVRTWRKHAPKPLNWHVGRRGVMDATKVSPCDTLRAVITAAESEKTCEPGIKQGRACALGRSLQQVPCLQSAQWQFSPHTRVAWNIISEAFHSAFMPVRAAIMSHRHERWWLSSSLHSIPVVHCDSGVIAASNCTKGKACYITSNLHQIYSKPCFLCFAQAQACSGNILQWRVA